MAALLRRFPLRIVRIDWPLPALELVHRNGNSWFLCPLPTRKDRW